MKKFGNLTKIISIEKVNKYEARFDFNSED